MSYVVVVFLCRYIDDVFMSSNMSTAAIRRMLDWMNDKDGENIRITYSIGFKVEFLDVQVENHHGSLKTAVYRKPAAEPYILPYTSDHPRHVHVNIPYEALLHAVRLCSDVYAFDNERLNIEIKLLLNEYPPRFVKYHFDRFFRLNQVPKVFTELDAEQYQALHQKFLHLPTRREKKYQRLVEDKMGDELLKHCEQLATKQWNKKLLMVPHTFESGPSMEFKRHFRQLWTKYYVYEGSLVRDVRVMITALCNPSLNKLLVRKKPPASLLTKMETSSEMEHGQNM